MPVTLPAARTASAAPASDSRGPLKGRILVIDDEAPLAEFMRELLHGWGLEATAITNPRKALQTFRADAHAYDLVITDLAMPGLSGWEVAREVAALRPEVPVFLVTGFGVEGQGWGGMLDGQQWDTAAEIGARVAEAMMADPTPDPLVVNLNVPNRPLAELAGWKRTDVAWLPPRALASAQLVPMAGHDDAFDVQMNWGDPVDLAPDTDSGAVEAGYVTVTALSRITDDQAVDLAAVQAALDDVEADGVG